MGPHHDAVFDALLRCHLDDLQAQVHRLRMVRLGQAGRASRRQGRQRRSNEVRCHLARTLVALARRLDPDAGMLPRPGGTPGRA